ncbi:MAG: hypothetical protein K2O35_05480 [Clostridia bacterium]|nr:hypothetical protein [Clostridia bacterium]
MKVVSWILFVLSIILLPILAITGVTGVFEDPLWVFITIGVAAFLILGFISHIIIARVGERKEKASFALYILTAPAYYIFYIVLRIVFFWLDFIDLMFYIGCGKRYISEALKTIIDIITPYKTQHEIEEEKMQEEEKNKIEVFTINYKGYKRELTYTTWQGKRQKTDYNDKSPYYFKEYKLLIDDLGNYWRSYDGGKSFIREVNGEIVDVLGNPYD